MFRRPDATALIAYHAWTAGRVGYPRGARSLRIDKLGLVGGRPFVGGPTWWPASLTGDPSAPGSPSDRPQRATATAS